MVELARIEPLAGRQFAHEGVAMRICPPADRLSLRGGEEARAAFSAALGIELPSRPKRAALAQGLAALWLGPDEWLVIAGQGSDIAEKAAGAAGSAGSAVDVSHRNTAFMLEGGKAATVLASGCPQDLSMAAFPPGCCSRTILGKAEIVLLREAEDRFRVECWRSFSDYVWNYCKDSAKSA